MKMLILSAVAVLASASMMAVLNPTAVLRITMSSADGSDVATLIESTEDGFSAAYENGYNAVLLLTSYFLLFAFFLFFSLFFGK
jgi:hypothetical protein